MAVTANSLFHVTVGILIDLPNAVVDYKQIQLAVVVVVEPASADGPHLLAIHLGAAEPGLRGYVGECAVAVVMGKAGCR